MCGLFTVFKRHKYQTQPFASVPHIFGKLTGMYSREGETSANVLSVQGFFLGTFWNFLDQLSSRTQTSMGKCFHNRGFYCLHLPNLVIYKAGLLSAWACVMRWSCRRCGQGGSVCIVWAFNVSLYCFYSFLRVKSNK